MRIDPDADHPRRSDGGHAPDRLRLPPGRCPARRGGQPLQRRAVDLDALVARHLEGRLLRLGGDGAGRRVRDPRRDTSSTSRSTGRDAVDCPLLNASDNPIGEAVAECVGILGRTIDYFTNGDAADDVDAVRAHLLGPDAKVDLVTMGHATSLGQAYLARYANHLRSATLDEAVNPNAWADVEIRENTAIVGRICTRSARCSARIDRPVDEVQWLATRLQRSPITGWTTLPDGTPWHVTLIEQYAVGGILFSGPFTFARSAGLPAAIRAYRKGDTAPLLRLAANAGIGDPGPSGPPLTFADDDPSEWSAVGIMAAGCNEWPAGWDVQADEATRRAQNAAAFAALPADVFGVFSKAIFFGIDEGCIRWPAPVRVNRINPPGAAFASVPILVLGGDLNQDHPQTAALHRGGTVSERHLRPDPARDAAEPHEQHVRGPHPPDVPRYPQAGEHACRSDEGSTVLGIGAFPRTSPARRRPGEPPPRIGARGDPEGRGRSRRHLPRRDRTGVGRGRQRRTGAARWDADLHR